MFLFRARIALVSLVSILLLGAHIAVAFTVSPAIQELTLRPGESGEVSVKIANDQNRPRAYVFSIQKFIPKGELGQQEFLPQSDTSGLPEWMYLDRSVLQLDANASAVLPVRVTVPADAKAGGYYAALFISEQVDVTAGANEAVAVLPRTGVLFLVTVTGDLVQDFDITSFAVSPQNTNRLPVSFKASVENAGNVHVIPTGEIRIRNMFGQTVSKHEVNASEARILPSSTREFQAVWSKADDADSPAGFFSELKKEWMNFAIGRYDATISLHGNGVEKTRSAAFYVWPWRLMTLIGSAIVLAAVFFALWFRRYRRSLLVG